MVDHATSITPRRIFISYAKEDERTASAVRDALSRAGYRPSAMTADIPPGGRWIAIIFESLNAADTIVLLLSRSAEKSSWVNYETAAAIAATERSRHKRIIPVALGKNVSPSGLLAPYQWVLTSGNPGEVADAVLKAIEEASTVDKDEERESARQSLAQASAISDFLYEATNASSQAWSRLLRLALAFGLSVATIAIIVSFSVTKSPWVISIVSLTSSLGGLVAGTMGFAIGRSWRWSSARPEAEREAK
jgi:hypothetical protein